MHVHFYSKVDSITFSIEFSKNSLLLSINAPKKSRDRYFKLRRKSNDTILVGKTFTNRKPC